MVNRIHKRYYFFEEGRVQQNGLQQREISSALKVIQHSFNNGRRYE
jgi:hypothetical protein